MSIRPFRQLGARLVRLSCASLLLIFAVSGQSNAATCRVTSAGTSAGSGAWASPMDPQTALTTASCTEVWVAKGVYKAGSARTDTFNIKPGVTVYGGFVGNEASLGQRDPAVNVTILSGDIDNNDLDTDGNHIAETSADIQGANSYHVVSMDGVTGAQITASTVLDGFTITAGQANNGDSPEGRGGGLYCDGAGSGHQCSPTLRNITFSGNSAQSGGAIFNHGRSGGASDPNLSHITFAGNNANVGGAMFNVSSDAGSSSPSISNATFIGNSANFGGAMYNWGEAGDSSPRLSNVTFTGNVAGVEGGALHNNGTAGGSSYPILSNVILWGNMATTRNPEIINYAATGGSAIPVIDHSVVQGSGGSANWVSAFGQDAGDNVDADPRLGTPGDHGGSTATLLLGPGSSAIDAGNAGTCADPATVNALDQRGLSRPQGAACDIGAVEMEWIFADGFEA